MPKYRKLWVKTIESQSLEEMPDDTYRLFWVLLPLGLDAEGRGIDNPAWVKSRIFPLRTDIKPDNIEDMLNFLERRQMILRYSVDGRNYFQILNWHRYQGDTSREQQSYLPAPEANHESVESKSRLILEPITTKSMPDADADADSDAEADSKNASSKKKTDERLKHPTLVTYRDVIHFHITPAWRDAAIETVGASSASQERWREILVEWLGLGYSPRNIKGMLEVYRYGWGKRKNKSAAKEQPAAEDILKELEEQDD